MNEKKNALSEKINLFLNLKYLIDKKAFLTVLFLEILIIGVQLINPFFYKEFVDRVLINKNYAVLVWIIVGKCSAFLVNAVLIALDKHIKFKFVNKIIVSLKEKVLIKYMELTAKERERKNVGDYEQIVNVDVNNYEKFFNEQIIDYIISILFILSSVVLLFVINYKLAIVSFLIVPIPYVIGSIIGKVNYRRQLERRVLYGEYETFLYNSLQSWKEVKALQLEEKELDSFYQFRMKIAHYDMISGYWEFVRQSVDFFSEILSTKILIYFVGGLFVMRGDISIGSLLMFASYYGDFYTYVSKVNKSNYEFYNDLPSLKRVIQVLKESEGYENKTINFNSNIESDVLFYHVSFKYDQSKKGLNDICFEVKNGEKLAIVGKSGCGKSTIAKLLLGMYECEEGTIYFGRHLIGKQNTEFVHDLVGVVMQDSMLFNMSIRDNLLLVKEDATDEEIEHACEKANILEVINSMPNKYDTVIGEKGVKLSGGQKQRLAIARMFLKMPDIIIFDEATSALDSESEEKIHSEMRGFLQDKTTIIIAHRLSSVLLADYILVIDQGQIVGYGKHEQLLQDNAIYKELFAEQAVGII